jgi:hypothetical protein
VTHQQLFSKAHEELRHMRTGKARRLFEAAELAHYDPDSCAAGRWTCHMLEGNFNLAWKESDAISGRRKPDPHRFWDGRPLKDRKILVRCLHGLGDSLQFVRYAPLIRREAKRLSIEVQPRLKPLLEESRIAEEVIAWTEPEPEWDQQIEIIELPRIFRTTLETIPAAVPYLDVSSAPLIAPYNGSRQLRVGIVWAAGGYNPARSIPIEELAALFALSGVSFFSLQAGEECEQLDLWRNEVQTLKDVSSSVLATAKALKNLDLVITVDTMVAHLSGALARPVWTLLPYQCDWRWMLDREDSPWYPTMRLFRQAEPGTWDSVLKRVQRDLAALIHATQREYGDPQLVCSQAPAAPEA